MKTNKSAGSELRDLDAEDKTTARRSSWDFSSCPEDEVDECHAYEFARHVVPIRDEVAHLRKGKALGFDRLFKELREPVLGSASRRRYALFWFYPEFPTKAYLEIPVGERRRRFKIAWPSSERAAESAMLVPKILPQFLDADLRSGVRKFGRPVISHGSLELALLEIDWGRSDKRLLERFAAWLSENRPPEIRIGNDKGAGNFIRKRRADLKALGAWRLLKWSSGKTEGWIQAFLISSDSGKSKGLYSNHPKPWKEAAKHARSILRRLVGTYSQTTHG